MADGEKHFYRRQEVIDLVNVLRCVRHPDDQVALVGVLRSALGALTDRELVELAALDALDYRNGGPPRLSRHSKAAQVRRLYHALESLRRDCSMQPLPDALDLVFSRLPVLELAAASLHGEQAVANLWKIRDLAEDLAADPDMTPSGFVSLLAERVADPPQESESGLAEESREAVRVMSMHKAKGLEFPIVVLVGIHAGTAAQRDRIQVQQDWSTAVCGIRLGPIGTVGGLFASEKLDARMVAEHRRLLYVGMTRAKERLILSGALTGRSAPGNFLSLLREVIGEAVGKQDATELAVGEGRLTQAILLADEGRPRERMTTEQAPRPPDDVPGFEARRYVRAERWAQCRERPAFVTPTARLSSPKMAGDRDDARGEGEQGFPMNRGALIGSLVHKALEKWSYHDKVEVLLEQLAYRIDHEIPGELRGRHAEILQEARDVLTAFARSDAYAELQAATILGREVPFIMPWPSAPSALMEGRIDLLYEKDGDLWVADYKTDRLAEADIPARVDVYRSQAHIYTEAVRRALGRPPAGFTLIFLRLGISRSVGFGNPVVR